jgi:hypothetical protein
MIDMKDIMRRKRERDKNAYRKGFEEGGFAGASSIVLIFLLIYWFIVPLTR